MRIRQATEWYEDGKMIDGNQMMTWCEDLFPINRSLTGEGTLTTLKYLRNLNPTLEIKSVSSGTEAFDWKVPKEWNVREAYIADLSGNKLVDITENNLHLVGYSIPIDAVVPHQELMKHIHSLPAIPNAIPYVTSYYKETWGFCIAESDREKFIENEYRVLIDSTLSDGVMNYGELLIPGTSDEEVLFSTYVCHPSMANNELSGPVVLSALAQMLSATENHYSYRFLFLPETIGSIYYISQNLEKLREKLVAGWVVTCIGFGEEVSYIPSRKGSNLADRISKNLLNEIQDEVTVKHYSWLDRGSDERQFCAPGVDLPVCSITRAKYDAYPEYHTSLDDLSLLSRESLEYSVELLMSLVLRVEKNCVPKTSILCEPQLGRRGLYPSISTPDTWSKVKDQMNYISYCDGESDLLEICEKTQIRFEDIIRLTERLEAAKIICRL